MSGYIYDADWEQERARLAGLEAALDPGTFRILDELGVAPGWRCLEIGGGGGSVARWLAERVGNEGHLVVTDLDPRFVLDLEGPTVDVRKHDIVTDPLEENVFDLVHSRDVLEHIPEREAVLDRMIAALKPGGWLVVEDVDFNSGVADPGWFGERVTAPLLAKMSRILVAQMRARGVEPEYGRRLPWRLAARGLTDIGAEVRSRLARAGTPQANVGLLSLMHLRPMLVASGEMSDAEVDTIIEAARSPSSMMFAPLHVAAWGRKP